MMLPPVISRPREPALFARASGVEYHRVAPAGVTVVALIAGDRLTVIDVEGLQAAELIAVDEQGQQALASLGLMPNAAATYIPQALQQRVQADRDWQRRLARHQLQPAQLPPGTLL